MTTLALPAATVFIAAPINGTGTILPAAEANAIGANGGFSFPNTGAVYLRYVCAAGGTGTLSILFQSTVEGQTPPPFVLTITASTTYIWGPFSRANHNDVNGLVQCTVTGTQTTSSAGIYLSSGVSST